MTRGRPVKGRLSIYVRFPYNRPRSARTFWRVSGRARGPSQRMSLTALYHAVPTNMAPASFVWTPSVV